MNMTLALSAIMIAVILVSGTLGFVLTNPDAFASGQWKGNDENKGKEGHGQKGCETATNASQDKTKNPHCETKIACEVCVDDFLAAFDECRFFPPGPKDLCVKIAQDALRECAAMCQLNCEDSNEIQDVCQVRADTAEDECADAGGTSGECATASADARTECLAICQ